MDVAGIGYSALRAIVLIVAIATLFRMPRRVWPVRLLTLCAIVAFGVCAVLTYQVPYDFKRFWQVGRDLAAGVDYYGLSPTGGRQLILNPPTALPLFWAWSMLNLRDAAGVWTAFNAIGGMGLVPLAYCALRSQMGVSAPRLPRQQLGLLAAALGMSAGQWMGMALGQVSVLAVASILAALWAQGAKRPGLAGLALALATIKVNTLLPFLGLFLRREDRRSWVTFVLATSALCLATGPPAELPRRCATTLATIRATFEPGRVNDYSYEGESHISLVGVDHALFRLGLRDRAMIRAIQCAALLGLCLTQFARLGSGRIDRAEACATLGLIGGIFFYHRIYDEVLMVLPLTYGALRASTSLTQAERRRWAAFAALSLLVVFVSPDGLRMLEAASFEMMHSGARVRGAMLPLAAWLILLALGISLGFDSTAARHGGNRFGDHLRSDSPRRAKSIAACLEESR